MQNTQWDGTHFITMSKSASLENTKWGRSQYNNVKSAQRSQFLGEHTMGWYKNSLSQCQVSGRRNMRWYIMHNVKFSVPVSRHNGIVHTVTMSKSVYGSQFLREHIMGWFTK